MATKRGIQHIPAIDGLRAIAVAAVIFYHLGFAWIPGGFLGVDLFFVISGYLISSIIFKEYALNQFSYKKFYVHRINRIFPALILVMISCYGFGWFNLLADEFNAQPPIKTKLFFPVIAYAICMNSFSLCSYTI